MAKAIDTISSNRQLKDHRIRRIGAAIIDGVIMIVIWGINTIIIAILKVKNHR
jgi:hypothetical protein